MLSSGSLEVSPLAVVLTSLALVACSLVLKVIVSAVLDPLRDIPGPFLARFTHLWLAYQYYTKTWETGNTKLHRTYGSVVRIGPNHYSFQDGEANKIIYGHGSHFTKWYWYQVWTNRGSTNIFSETNPHTHSAMRKKLTSVYSMSSLISYEPFINECNAALRRRCDEAAMAGNFMDMQQTLQCYAFEVIGMLTFSRRLGFLDRCQDESGLIEAIHHNTQQLSFAGFAPWLTESIDRIVPFRSIKPFLLVIQHVMRQIDMAIKKSEPPKDPSAPRDFTEKLVEVYKTEPDKINIDDIVRAAAQNVMAGSDTTGFALTAIFYCLLKSPDKLEKLRHELSAARLADKLSEPIKFNEAQQLPYLQAVLKEAMRLHPSVGFTLPRVAPAEGATISGRYYPAGTILGVNPWVTHRDEALWGSDAAYFVPERWIEGRVPSEVNNMTFGQGARGCLGKNISLLEISKLVPELVQNYEFTLAPHCIEPRVKTRWFSKFEGFEVAVAKREKAADQRDMSEKP